MNPKVDAYFRGQKRWREELERLRAIALDCGLDEELKWRQPCYTLGGRNIAILQSFREKCALMFFQGSLLEDPQGLLEPPGANSRIAARMVFTGTDEIAKREKRIRAFLKAAIRIEEAGERVEPKKPTEPLPAELESMFREIRGLRKAFGALTPGRQREYVLHFSGAKQAATRRSRIERCVPRILDGRGMRDR